MKRLTSAVLLTLIVLVSTLAQAAGKFPETPEPSMTTGSLCKDSNLRRYKENIVYCERSVETSMKNQIIDEYDDRFGYSINEMNRGDFKIDHYIPLSLGGSNNRDNLWPQHKSVYKVTDPLEHLLFEKLNTGKISQSEAVQLIKDAKINLGRVPELIEYVQKM